MTIEHKHMHGDPPRISPPNADVPVDYPPQQQGYLNNMQLSSMMLYRVLILIASTYSCPSKQKPATVLHSAPINYNSTECYNKCPSPWFAISDNTKIELQTIIPASYAPATIGSARKELQMMQKVIPASHSNSMEVHYQQHNVTTSDIHMTQRYLSQRQPIEPLSDQPACEPTIPGTHMKAEPPQ